MIKQAQVAETVLPMARQQPAQVLIPLMPDSDNDSLLRLAHWLAAERSVLLMGIVPIGAGNNLSAGASDARKLRSLMGEHVDRMNLRAKPRIRVSYTPWDEVLAVLAKHTKVDLLVLDYLHQLEALRLTPAEILSHPPCDVAILRGPLPDKLGDIIVPMRGGPHAERGLQLALDLSQYDQAKVTALRLNSIASPLVADASFAGMELVLAEMPQVKRSSTQQEDQSQAILDASKNADMVILGTSAHPAESTASFGFIADRVLQEAETSVIAVKTKRVAMPEEGTRFSGKAISILVDRWFAENTFHADEFADLEYLVRLKEERKLSISLALPSLNEENTVGNVIRAAQRVGMKQFPLLDEIILIDSNSTDQTREIAADLGVPVYIHQEVLPEYGVRDGKGEALWKSLYVTSSDLLIWVDTDVSNFHPRFIYGQLGPLLQRTTLQFVKGFYRRPLKVGKALKAGRGGRVTELTARPLLNLFYPQLSGIIQPLSGEYGGRRELLEQLPFSSGYGVEIGLLIDVLESAHLASIGQVDMVERIHHGQSLEMLSRMSFAVLQTFFSKLEQRYDLEMLQDVNRTMKRVQQDRGLLHLEVEEVAERQRPPMITIKEYRQKRGLPLSTEDEKELSS